MAVLTGCSHDESTETVDRKQTSVSAEFVSADEAKAIASAIHFEPTDGKTATTRSGAALDKEVQNVTPSPKAKDISNVNMFYVTNGKEELYYQANLDVKKGFGLGPPRERIGPYYTITFALNLQPMGEITTTIIDWGNGCRDVIKAEYGIYPASIILEKAWLNDQLIMDTPHGLRSPNGVYEIKC